MATVRYSTIAIIAIVVGLLTAREITRDNIVSVQGADNKSIFRTRYNAASDNTDGISSSSTLNVTVSFDRTVLVSGIKLRLLASGSGQASITPLSLTSRYSSDCVTSYGDLAVEHVDGGVIVRRVGDASTTATTTVLRLSPATHVTMYFTLKFYKIQEITVNYSIIRYNIYI